MENAETIPIFVISLPDSTDRRETITARLDALSLPFEFVDAVDGRNGMPPEHEPMINREGAASFMLHPLSDAEFGCAMSHLLAYRRVVRLGLPFALILEDDAIPQPELPDYLESRHFEAFDIVSLCYSRTYIRPETAVPLSTGQTAYRCEPGVPVRGAVGYIVSLTAAQHINTHGFPVMSVADWPACTERFKEWGRWHLVHPRLVQHTDRNGSRSSSIIKPTRMDRQRRFLGVYLPPWKKVWRSCKWKASYRIRGFRKISW